VVSQLTEDQTTFREGVRAFLARRATSAAMRQHLDSDEGFDRSTWRLMAEQLGLQGIHLPEEYGGSGFGAVELCLVSREVGRVLLPAPWLSTVVLAATGLVESGDREAMARWLPGIAAGETVATVALAEADGRHDPSATTVVATPAGDGTQECPLPPTVPGGHLLHGVKDFVLDGCVADLLLVPAREGDDVSLFAVAAPAPGLTRAPVHALDPTRRLARATLDGTRAERVGGRGEGPAILARTLDLAAAAIASEAVGGAEAVLATSVGYAKDRHQFGRPIGSFQAIKHRCADLLVEIDSAGLLAEWAAHTAAEQPADTRSFAASTAKAYCTDAFLHAAAAAIQIHGGIGFTWEHDAHLYFKRAKFDQLLLGQPDQHRERAAQALLSGAAA
jgi:alkylation response protein AidB-like acyl-CoA dehydrogenase